LVLVVLAQQVLEPQAVILSFQILQQQVVVKVAKNKTQMEQQAVQAVEVEVETLLVQLALEQPMKVLQVV
jgi:hypothetical protein